MMTRNPYTFENDDDNNIIDTNSVNADNRNVRKHKSLMNMKSNFHSSIPRRSSSINRNKTLRSSASFSNDNVKEKLQYSPTRTTVSTGLNHNNLDKDTSYNSFLSQLEKDKKMIDIKGKQNKSKYFPESVEALLSQSSKNVKSLDDEKASYLLNKYTNLLRKPKETLSESTESKYINSSSSSSSSSIPHLSVNPTESTRKPYKFTAVNLSHSENKENVNNSMYDTDNSSSLSSRHSTSRLKCPMSFNKKRIPLSEIKLTDNKNVEEQSSILKQQFSNNKKDASSSSKIMDEPVMKKSTLNNSKENTFLSTDSTNASKIKASIPISPKTPPAKKSVASLLSDIDSVSPFSLSPLSSSKDDLIHQFNNSSISDEQKSDNEIRNSIDDKTILNTFTVAFDNISSLSTKIDLLTEIMDKNEERQQQQYSSDMNQINFELFEIKQKVSQSMKRLQQEFDPILNVLKEKTEQSEEKKEEKNNDKAITKSEENNILSLESAALNENTDRMQQDLAVMKSQLVNITNKNQILKKRLDIITRKLPYLFVFHIITFIFLVLIFIHEMPSNKKQDIYQFGIQGKNFVLHYIFSILHWMTRTWNQMMAYLNNQYYY